MLLDPVEDVAAVKDIGAPSAQASTSSQVTGVDTVGRGRARSE